MQSYWGTGTDWTKTGRVLYIPAVRPFLSNVVWAGLCPAVRSPRAPCTMSEPFISVPPPPAAPGAPSGRPCPLSARSWHGQWGRAGADWNHPALKPPSANAATQATDDSHSLLTHPSNCWETAFPNAHVLEPAGLSPIFYSDPKEHSGTEKYTLIRNTRNHRPHPTQKHPERVCHIQTVKPNT